MNGDCTWCTPHERLLHALEDALRLHGLSASAGLMLPETFPQHRGGIGIIVCVPARKRPAVAALLQAMGCMVRDHDIGIEGHLRAGTELGPAPSLPPVQVAGADSCSVAELAAEPVPAKRCATCKALAPVESYSWWNRRLGKRSPYCPACNRARINAARAASRQPVTAGR